MPSLEAATDNLEAALDKRYPTDEATKGDV